MNEQPELPQEEWISWTRGAELLGIKKSAFFYLVEEGQIRSQPGTPPRKGRYSSEDILSLKREREQRNPLKPYRKRLSELVLDWLTIPNMSNVADLNYQVSQDHFFVELDRYTQWMMKNPYLFQAAFDANDHKICLGYLGFIPLPEQVILAILSGERNEESITPNEILAYDQPGEYTLLANKLVVSPDRTEELLTRLTSAMADFWVDQSPSRSLRKIYAKSTNPTCDYAIGWYHLAPRYDVGGNAFELDLARPGLVKPIRDFQQRVREKAI
jgi:hypothetical protein